MEEEKPSLLGFSAELRNKIHDLVVPSPHRMIALDITPGNKTVDKTATSPPPTRRTLALSQTCRQLRQETLPMLFSCNTMVFKVEYYLNAGEAGTGSKHNGIGTHTENITDVRFMLESLRKWLDSAQENSTRHMRDVCIWLGKIDMRSGDSGAVNKSLEFLYDTWNELQQHVSRLGLSGTRAARFGLHFRVMIDTQMYDGPDMFNVPLGDRSEARRESRRELIVTRASLLQAQDEELVKTGLPPRGVLLPEFEQDIIHQESIVQILYD
ncbi:hypothetical protein LTR17_015345 [Elasticomyces elasticus]|nr:hypothetical protein LTR17_015345 [Elasticomyces elasticus]